MQNKLTPLQFIEELANEHDFSKVTILGYQSDSRTISKWEYATATKIDKHEIANIMVDMKKNQETDE
jgi:site-specific recombinase XerD